MRARAIREAALLPDISADGTAASSTAEQPLSTEWDWDSAMGPILPNESPSKTRCRLKKDCAIRAKARVSCGKARWTIRYLEGSVKHPKTVMGIFRGTLDTAEFDKPGGANHYAIVNGSNSGRLLVEGKDCGTVAERRCSPGTEVFFELDMDAGVLKMKPAHGKWVILCDHVPAGEWSPILYTFGKSEKVELADFCHVETAGGVDEDPAVPSSISDAPRRRRAAGASPGAAGSSANELVGGSPPPHLVAQAAGTELAALVVDASVPVRNRLRAAMAAPVPQGADELLDVCSEG